MALGIGFALMPVMGSLAYEFTSNLAEIKAETARVRVTGIDVAPVADNRRLGGATLSVSGVLF